MRGGREERVALASATASGDDDLVALLEHFADREEGAALQKLATQSLPGEEMVWREEFLDTMAQLEKQVAQQRIDELQERLRGGGFAALSADEKNELLELQGLKPRI